MYCLTRSFRCSHAALVGGWAVVAATCVVAASLSAPHAGAAEAEWVMYRDPELPKPALETRFSSQLVPLWIQALERPERDLCRRAAAALVRAQQKGLPGLDAAAEPLMRMLRERRGDRVVRLTVVQALVAIDAHQAASLLREALEPGDLDLAELIEPALARWEDRPMAEVWLERLAGPVMLRRMHVLAIRGLTALGEPRALPRLAELAQDRTVPTDVRLEAAAALGMMQPTGLEAAARQLIPDNKPGSTMVDRLVAARLLKSHRSQEAASLLTELAGDPQPAVQAVALEHLYQIDPALIMPLMDQTIVSPDVKVRRWAADALAAGSSPEKTVRLATLLDDIDPDLRRHVCDCLLSLAREAALHDVVIAEGRRALSVAGWRGQEQAIILLVLLDDRAIAEQLLGLLEDDRVEVHTTAAWGLSRLEVPATAEPICAVFQQKTAACLAGGQPKAGTYLQLSHLAQALGRLRHQPADPTLREYIRKMSVLHPNTRAAALWALGYLHADQPDETVSRQLLERAMDDDVQIPEDLEVRRMAAISLGRMKVATALDGMRSIYHRNGMQSALGCAAAWTIRELTGEEIPAVAPYVVWEDDWFLVPNERHDRP